MKTDRPSEEVLNAFVDGEFCPEERLACLRHIASDDSLSREVCDLSQIKEMVNLAYEKVPHPPRSSSRRARTVRGGWLGPAAAAVVVMLTTAGVVGLGIGTKEPARQFTTADMTQPLYGSERFANRILLHVNTRDEERLTNMLDEVESLMAASRQQGVALQILVVTHGEGLALVREDVSPFPERITALSERYAEGLKFVACLNTIERLRREEHLHVRLLPVAEVVNSGVAEVIRRQSQGWAYIQV
ncbi:hypothetical protein B1C78_11740 [Thioalkalivibrio denitrificans]|uniref:Uncharacterized protein n=1 Tax=Thioalkalivibrio denitrificans TaxID=108003 RepID=A0A1V3NE51_9GAMM|nr:hypothetical protein [Thioalkalivibrio denitrificans]OOG23284.1 hypothetical protein B1C78_11740 [Thioalkalivibrio denitrificans]